MEEKKHKRKINHVILVTSDADDAGVKRIRFNPWVLEAVILILCVVIGAMVGYMAYESKFWDAVMKKSAEKDAVIEQMQKDYAKLEKEKQDLQDEMDSKIESLEDKILVMSNTLTQKVQSEAELQEEIDKQSIPVELPLNGPANVEELTESTPMCLFTANANANLVVIATAAGTVTAVEKDSDFGTRIVVDHGNGYNTIYRNKGESFVKQGDAVVQGTPLFKVTKKNTRLGYQITLDGEYINPMEMLTING